MKIVLFHMFQRSSKRSLLNIAKKSLVIFTLIIFCQAIIISPVYSFSIGEERDVGNELLYTIRKVLKLVDEPDIQQYFNRLGDEVLAVSKGSYFRYRFYIINDSGFNAFAAPAGLIFFNSGLIEATNSENELVSVLSHEVAHATFRHIAAQVEKGTAIGIATIGLALAALALGGGEASQALFIGSFAAGKSFQLHFSRGDEEEADRMAYEWMKQMGRDPKDMESMLRTMRRITRYRMGKTVPQYLLTHPNPEVRLDYIQTLLQKDKDKNQSFPQRDQFEFFRMKYRVLSTTWDSEKLRNNLATIIADSGSSDFEVIMAKYGLSQLDRIENNFGHSMKLLEEVMHFFPDKPILLADKGVIQYESGNINEAISLFEEARSKDYKDMYSTFLLAKLYSSKNDFKKAEEYLGRVAAELVDYPKVYFELGRLKSKQSNYGDSQYYLGKYNMFLGRIKLATKNFEKAKEGKKTSERLKKDADAMLKLIKKVKDK